MRDEDLDGRVARATGCGRRPGVEVRILDDEGEEVPTGEPGLIYVMPPGGARFHYHEDTEKTDRAWRDDAFTVGDVGFVDADGYLYLTDRAADMVIRGGVNIYPREIEDVLYTHPSVVDCAVFGVPDERLGEQLMAVVETPTRRMPTHSRLHARAPRRLQGSGGDRDRRRAAAPAQRQGPQAPPPRTALDRFGHEHLGRRWTVFGHFPRLRRGKVPKRDRGQANRRSARRSWCQSVVPIQYSEP